MRFLPLLLIVAACADRADEPAAADAPGTDTLPVSTAIGGLDDTRPEYEFAAVGGILALPDGGVAVVDRGNDVVRLYDDGGTHRFSFGRSGAGPGELSGPCCPALDAQGRLWLRDGGNSRYNVYALAGDSAAYLYQVRMSHSDANRCAPVTFDDAGSVIDIGNRSTQEAGTQTVRFHTDSAGNVERELVLHRVPDDSVGMKTVEREVPGGSARLFFYPPFGPTALYAHSPTGEVAHGLSSRYAIDWRAADGTLTRQLTRDVGPGPGLSAAEREAAEERIASNVERSGLSRGQLGSDVPERKQPLRALWFDGEGRLWVQLTTADGADATAHVYAPDGTLQRTVVWPGNVDLRDGAINAAALWGMRTDSLGVATIVRLPRPAGS